MCAAEFAAHKSNRIIGERKTITPYLATSRRTSHRDETNTRENIRFPLQVATIMPDLERTLRDMFDITVRDLLEDDNSQPSQRGLEHQDSDLVGSLASMGIHDE